MAKVPSNPKPPPAVIWRNSFFVPPTSDCILNGTAVRLVVA